ncbi:MAG TPA: glycosyltransferase family 4 protein, partial [Methylocella sp.]|nr:glycosyltransferase family 4 protein [Methylocella sp.]
ARAILLRDRSALLPALAGAEIMGIGGRAAFFARSFLEALRSKVFIIGHINLLPLAAAVRCLRPSLPILLFVHGDEVWNHPRHRRKRWHESWLLHALTLIASVSRYTACAMTREFGVSPGKIRLLPNAVDPLQTPPDPSGRAKAAVLTVTRLGAGDREKNVDSVIRAIARLKSEFPGLRYYIVGDGVLRPELQSLAAELGVADIVKFLGRLTDSELDAAYARASVFAMPSSKEGFGIVYLEAWQRGLPVICSTEGAAPEVVTDGADGFAVNPSDIAMLASRLRFLISEPEAAKAMGERGRQKVEAHYLDPAFRSNLDAILGELLAAPREEKALRAFLP